ncbi:hypothetical protein M011DRAFT_517668 [Sporormia fimetaria CBS 119925]|uniref:dolichol kinase n=1 Tax=Sporormia fimetaria CBS 119925 TaxID=1340428 RepID=A0A6A6VIX0_9PLEO|nr:hypothetical protein M011DRAFT_517668 [Sporormia fimetaria CBS 119925]
MGTRKPENWTAECHEADLAFYEAHSSMQSGTEADDEGYGLVKALPAPPMRPRKGLRDMRGAGFDGAATPLPTPSQVDEDGRRYSLEYFRSKKSRGKAGSPSPTDEERAAREKYRKRRRNELFRRSTETVLLAFIGLLAVRGCSCWKELLRWQRELIAFIGVLAGLLCLYPARLLLYSRRQEPDSSLWFCRWIHVPSAFDPATILYPVLIPTMLSISLFSSLEKILLPNLLLGLAASPRRLIPYVRSEPGYSSLHWALSILPLAISENTDLISKKSASVPYKLKLPPPGKGLHPELLVTLFALHQTLLPPLHYLTTTSLLPAELQLLSIGLINLLLFAESPQTIILRTLLWVGGISLFVLCGKVLKWGVALARIPKWRLRRAGNMIKNQQSFLHALSAFKPRSRGTTAKVYSDSDADEDGALLRSRSLKKKREPTLEIITGVQNSSIPTTACLETKSAVEPKETPFPEVALAENGQPPHPAAIPQRRSTLPTLPSQNPTSTSRRTRLRSKSLAQSFLTLTPAQAALRKWLYAGYFYLVVILIILVPIRLIISSQALSSHDPFGWAIGYLLGNNRWARFHITTADLTSWIPLPSLPSSPTHRPTSIAESLSTHPATTRLYLTGYLLTTLTAGLLTVLLLPLSSPNLEVDTRRKVFHGTIVAMLFPTLYLDPPFTALALSLVLSVFLLLDLIRASQLPPLSTPIARFLTPYVDGRDLRGPVVVSHIFLLVGCAVPVWLSLAGVKRTGDEPWAGWSVEKKDVGVDMLAGVICVGMGDAAASLVGRRWGRRKWCWAGGKSLEGSAAFAGAVVVGLVGAKVWLLVGGWGDGRVDGWMGWASVLAKAGICAAGASLNEAVLTGGNDNVVVPVLLWVLVRAVGL